MKFGKLLIGLVVVVVVVWWWSRVIVAYSYSGGCVSPLLVFPANLNGNKGHGETQESITNIETCKLQLYQGNSSWVSTHVLVGQTRLYTVVTFGFASTRIRHCGSTNRCFPGNQ
ncbi:hypothetical protein BJ508DRAFT_414708 [Ascobolus immersus RN42]|uniref:Uncharacterized protein n=1 Tax=Ascobolus immersus RN42 TaxID=1160509 RepID=A0A3N4I5S7_ASCIM|nr:hypothetical protein BJ508DRAFT_414708 [Ascobolus immersus RN42]